MNFLQQFYLAGGTALALQLGHRKSIDLDFFTPVFPKHDILLQDIHSLAPTVINQTQGTLDVVIDTVKVSFLSYTYPLLFDLQDYNSCKLAHIKDIACMKLSAISSRGSKKDFVDLYEILKTETLETIFEDFDQKFKEVSYEKLHIVKSLVYFDDAEKEPDPDFLVPLDWLSIKDSLTQDVVGFINQQKV